MSLMSGDIRFAIITLKALWPKLDGDPILTLKVSIHICA